MIFYLDSSPAHHIVSFTITLSVLPHGFITLSVLPHGLSRSSHAGYGLITILASSTMICLGKMTALPPSGDRLAPLIDDVRRSAYDTVLDGSRRNRHMHSTAEGGYCTGMLGSHGLSGGAIAAETRDGRARARRATRTSRAGMRQSVPDIGPTRKCYTTRHSRISDMARLA